MKKQTVMWAKDSYDDLYSYIINGRYNNLFLVCGKSFEQLRIAGFFKYLIKKGIINVVRFSDFQPNPSYESVIKGVELFRRSGCDTIIAVGGGSAIDVAKCIKLFAYMDDSVSYLEQTIKTNDIRLIAVPTTAGTGTEATRFAVIYHNGIKQSVSDESCIPDAVFFDTTVLDTLPEYHRKASMLDALCHAMESYWSVNSTEESRVYSCNAIVGILRNMQAYLHNESIGNEGMLMAANEAGKAINITQTTAGHAMCYKLTDLYGIAHGHAAALCVSVLLPYIVDNMDKCADVRGRDYLEKILVEMTEVFGCDSIRDVIRLYDNLLLSMDLPVPDIKEADVSILRDSVNIVRLKNTPVYLESENIEKLYRRLREKVYEG